MVSAIPFGCFAGFALGWAVDHLFGTGRLFTLLCALAGFAVGIVQLFRGLAQLSDAHPHDPPP